MRLVTSSWSNHSLRGLPLLLLSCVGCLLFPARHALADALEALASPGVRDSHLAYVERVQTSHQTAYDEAVARYDAWIKAHANAPLAAVERCRFMVAVADATADNEGGPSAEPEACIEALLEQHPDLTPAILLQVERHWGEEAIALGMATVQRHDLDWSPEDRRRLYAHLAWSFQANGKLAAAGAWAMQARGDQAMDVSTIVAEDFKARGMRSEAIHALMRASKDYDYGFRKVQLLVELEAFDDALQLIEVLAENDVEIDATLHARALAGAGKTEAARTKYREAAGIEWKKAGALEQLFYIDVRNGKRAQALQSYAALRDMGWEADPLARHRVSLAHLSPTLPWSLRDLLGVLTLIGVCAAMALLPLLWILPAHYTGLLRKERGKLPQPLTTRWSLKHAWLLGTCLLIAQTLSAYVFAYEEVATLFDDRYGADFEPATKAAPYGIATFLSSAMVTGVLVLRRGAYGALIRSRWSAFKNVSLAAACVVLLLVVRGLTLAACRKLGWEVDDDTLTGIGVSTHSILKALLQEHGVWTALAIVAIAVPIYEEFAFRGVFLGSLSQHLPFSWANALQASVFALVHDDMTNWPALFLLALITGLMTRRAGGLAPAIVLHAVLNGFAITALVAQDHLRDKRVARDELQGSNASGLSTLSDASLAERCATDDGPACATLAQGHVFGHALRTLPDACAGGDANACDALGKLHAYGRGMKQSLPTAVKLFEQACSAGAQEGCVGLGTALDFGSGIERDSERAVSLFTRACESGVQSGCERLANAFGRGRGVELDIGRAVSLHENACAANHAPSCSQLGAIYLTGTGVARDYTRSRELTERACAAGHGAGCNDLGVHYADGFGVARDPRRAAHLYAEACDAGFALGCRNVGKCAFEGRGVARDLKAAFRAYSRACEHGDGPGCLELGRFYARGDSVALDTDRARTLFERGCKLGSKAACDEKLP